MKQSVVVNGVSLTRKQVEDALAELNKPEDITLNTSYINEWQVPLSNGQTVTIGRRISGRYHNKGLFLIAPPTGYRWALKEETGYESARTLIIEKVG